MTPQSPQANKTPITIYNFYENKVTNFVTYNRTFLERSHLDPNSVSNENKFGVATKDKAALRIYDVAKYKTQSEYALLPQDEVANYYTVSTATPTARNQSFILLGEITHEFTPGTTASIDTQVTVFKKQYSTDNYRSELVDLKDVGSPRMWHVVVSLKRTV